MNEFKIYKCTGPKTTGTGIQFFIIELKHKNEKITEIVSEDSQIELFNKLSKGERPILHDFN